MRRLAAALVIALGAVGCTKETPPAPVAAKPFVPPNPAPLPAKVDPPGSPEAAYRAFMLANLTGSEAAIRPLVVDMPDVEWLWKAGAYPKDVAALLSGQYQGMEISRVGDASPDRVMLQSMGSMVPLTMVRDAKGWRLDASPVIALRKANP